jgi:hypothetical protein
MKKEGGISLDVPLPLRTAVNLSGDNKIKGLLYLKAVRKASSNR